MKFFGVLALVPMLLYAGPVEASRAEAREVARLNNCTPKKVEIYEQKIASSIQTVYLIECNLPKLVGEQKAPMASSILVQCTGALCRILRPVTDKVQ